MRGRVTSRALDFVYGVVVRRMLTYGTPSSRFSPQLYAGKSSAFATAQFENDFVRAVAVCAELATRAPEVLERLLHSSASAGNISALALLEGCVGDAELAAQGRAVRDEWLEPQGQLAKPELRFIKCPCPGLSKRAHALRALFP